MNRPAKLGRKNTAGAPNQKKPEAKPKPHSSRNPLRELNSCSLPSTQSRDVPKGGCFGLPPSSSSSSSSSSASSFSGSLPRSKSLPRTPKSAPLSSRNPLSFKNPDLKKPSEVPKKNPPSRPRFESLKQVGASKPQGPRHTDHLQRWSRSKVGSEGSFQKKKNAEAAMAKPPKLSVGVVLKGDNVLPKGSNSDSCIKRSPGRRAPPLHVPEVDVEVGFATSATPAGKISHGCILDVTPMKDGEWQQQHIHTPISTGTATPPVHASISPEILGRQSMMPTPACFAAGHLLAGVQDRRKCRPRGILNVGGIGGLEIVGNGRFGSLADDGNSGRASSTPPLIMDVSMHWLSSPCYDETGRLMGISSTTSVKGCPGEASVNWLLSPDEIATDQECALENFPDSSGASASIGGSASSNAFWSVFPDAIVNSSENSPEFKGLVSLTSSNHENTTCAVEFCCSPATNSSISPFSMILQKASASAATFKDLSPREERERCCYGSLVDISPLSGKSQGNSNVICTPFSLSSNGQVDSMSTLGLHTIGHGLETLGSFSSLVQTQSSGSKGCLPLSALSFQFSHASTPSNSVDLAHFRMPSCHQSSEGEGFPVEDEKLSCSDWRVSWREGLISRTFEIDELDCCNCLSDKMENVDSHAEEHVNSKRDVKLNLNSKGSPITLINEMDITRLTNESASFGFVDNERNEQQRKAKSSSRSLISCAESFSIEGDGLEASLDSDWNLFYKNNVFEGKRFGK